MKKVLYISVFVIFSATMVIALGALNTAFAQDEYTITCDDGSEPVLDLACQRAKLFGGGDDCQLLYCSDDTGNLGRTDLEDVVDVKIFNIFQVRLRVNSTQTFASLMFIGFSMFFGVVGLAAVGYGIYGAVTRANVTEAGDIAKAHKIMTNALIGIVLVVMSLLFAQLVASFLGVGSITEMVDIGPIFEEEPVTVEV